MPPETLARRAVRSFDGTELAAWASPPRDGAGTVLLLGPLGADLAAWRHQIAYLAPRYRVVAWDLRGLGASRAPPDPAALDVADHARDAAAVLADLAIARCAVLAWGEGAQIALDLAHRAPSVTTHLALVCPRWSGRFARALGVHAESSLPLFGARALAPTRRALARLGAPLAIAKRLGLVAASLDAELYDEVAARKRELDPTSLSAIARALGRHRDAPRPESLTMPVLVACGTRDSASHVLEARRLGRRLPFGELFVIDGASAWAPLEYPDLLNLRVEKFLDRNGFG